MQDIPEPRARTRPRALVHSAVLYGAIGYHIEIEAYTSPGRTAIVLNGLPDGTIHEVRDRIRAAIINSGLTWPDRRATVNILPASVPKPGSSLDLAIAVALLVASEQLSPDAIANTGIIGEVGLDGALRPVRGMLALAVAASRAGIRRLLVPAANLPEAALTPGITVHAARTLAELVDGLRGDTALHTPPTQAPAVEPVSAPRPGRDLADIAGQPLGRRALELAAAGGHHLALLGPPGSGGTMLAERLPSILPDLDDDAALEVSALYSAVGMLPPGGQLLRRPPWQAPHHTVTLAALLGSGSGPVRPGALPLAHRGTLLLNAADRFPASTIRAVADALHHGTISVTRAGRRVEFPTRAQLILTAAQCPCSDPTNCDCPPTVRSRYRRRLARLLDLVDIEVTRPHPSPTPPGDPAMPVEPSRAVAQRVTQARTRAAARWSAHGWRTNAQASRDALRHALGRVPTDWFAPLQHRIDSGSLSPRDTIRVLRLAFTVADLSGHPNPTAEDLTEAIWLRTGQEVTR
ncbi:ATP-binding protein [Actinomycetes bacterium KLBMP 9797]